MKKLVASIKMMITAVICFTMCLFAGKKVHADVKETKPNGQAVPNSTKKNSKMCNSIKKNLQQNRKQNGRNIIREKFYSLDLFMKKIFYWLQGPGDRMREFIPHSYLSGFV